VLWSGSIVDGEMRPTRSYIIWFSQRVASAMVTQALEAPGRRRPPREWLSVSSAGELLAKHRGTVHELRDTLWREATMSNGIIGTKYDAIRT
jgi:hypothetical protein